MEGERGDREGGRRLLGAALLLVLASAGCGTSMAITPQVTPREMAGFTLKGRISYEGNPEYLPRTIAEGDPGEAGLSFRYAYQVSYGKDNTAQILPLLNPLSLVGFPIGANTLIVCGKLDVEKAAAPVRSYTSTCAIDKARNLFYEGETFSEMRKRGLIAVRNNIEAQMFDDRDFLTGVTGGR